MSSFTYVQTLYDIKQGWQSVGSRRKPSDAVRFCALLNRIRNDHRPAQVRQVPVSFVLGE